MSRFAHPDTFEATRKSQTTELALWLGGCTDKMLAEMTAETLARRYPKLDGRDVAQRLLAAQISRSFEA